MATLQFDLVSPERRLASMEATEVQVPGAEGNMTAMPGHAPVITTLRPGIIKVIGPDATHEFVVSGGFAEITAEACTVLAERSHAVHEMDQGIFNQMVAHAREKHDKAKAQGDHGLVDDMVKVMGDMVALGTHIGLDVGSAAAPA